MVLFFCFLVEPEVRSGPELKWSLCFDLIATGVWNHWRIFLLGIDLLLVQRTGSPRRGATPFLHAGGQPGFINHGLWFLILFLRTASRSFLGSPGDVRALRRRRSGTFSADVLGVSPRGTPHGWLSCKVFRSTKLDNFQVGQPQVYSLR